MGQGTIYCAVTAKRVTMQNESKLEARQRDVSRVFVVMGEGSNSESAEEEEVLQI